MSDIKLQTKEKTGTRPAPVFFTSVPIIAHLKQKINPALILLCIHNHRYYSCLVLYKRLTTFIILLRKSEAELVRGKPYFSFFITNRGLMKNQ